MSENNIPELPEIPEPEFKGFDYIPPSNPVDPTSDPGLDWAAIFSVVAGVLSLCGVFFAPLGCLVSIVAIVLGFFGLKSTQKTLAIIGLVIGGIGVLLSLIAGAITLFGLVGTSVSMVLGS